MGGRKKKSRTSSFKKEKYEDHGMPNEGGFARNLPKTDLGAVIFGCTHHTFAECLHKKMFGLPRRHNSYVKNVMPGLTLFLFNYSDRTLHGIFEAVSTGQLNIDPYAWVTSEDTEITAYPAQVRIDVRRQCRPLPEKQFKPIIAENYYLKNLFYFELDKEQSRRLVKLFLSSPMPHKKIPCPPNTVKANNMYDALSDHDAYEAADNEFEYGDQQECSQTGEIKLTEIEHSSAVVVVGRSAFPHERKWSVLYNGSPSTSDNSGVKCEFASSHETSGLLPEAYPDMVNTEPDSIAVECGEDFVPFENEDSCLQVHIQGSRPDLTNRPENKTCLDGEVGQLKSPELELMVVKIPEDAFVSDRENVRSGNTTEPTENSLDHTEADMNSAENTGATSAPTENSHDLTEADMNSPENTSATSAPTENSHDHTEADMNSPENTNATCAQVLFETKSADYESLFIELIQEVEGLKATQLQQKMKIECLEQELADSRLEIHQLKSHYRVLRKIPSYASEHLDLDNCKLPSFLMEETVLIAGGFDGCSWLQDLSSYSPTQDHSLQLCPMSFARSFAAPALLNGELYILGGIHDNVWHDTVESYNPMSNQWVQKPALNKAKGNLAGASLNEKIFAIGGGNGVECCSEVEVFDLNVGRWVYTQPMHEKRFAPAATEFNGAIYVAGGYDEREYLRSVERFDPRERAWTRLRSMNSKRGCHSLVSFKEKLYALGGYSGDKMASTVEAFDPRIGLWTIKEPMHAAKGYFGSFVFGGKIYTIGGMYDCQPLDMVECYEEGLGWQVMGLTEIGKRCYFSSLVM